MTFVVLDSGSLVTTARSRLQAAGPIDVVLVRRLTLEGVVWHALDPLEVLGRVAAAPADARLGAIVPLDGMNEVPAAEVTAENQEGVVVDGNRVVAFSFPATAAPPPARRRGGGSAPLPVETARDTGAEEATDSGPRGPDPGLDRPEPTFIAHADIEAPTTVDRDEEFFVTLGLSKDPVAETLGAGILIADLPEDQATLLIDVHLVGDFAVIDAGGPARTVEVDRATLAHAPVAFKVTPGTPPASLDPSHELWIGRVMLLFSYQGAPCGQSWREIRVNMTGARANRLASERVPPAQGGSNVGPSVEPVPDLTISLTRTPSNATDGVFSLVLASPHLEAPIPPEPINLGDEPQAFSSQLIKQVNQHINDRVSDELMVGIGKEISDKLPVAFWATLQQVGDIVRREAGERVPGVLLLTDDPYVPWELAWMEELLDADAPPFLGAQVNIGRWAVDDENLPAGFPLYVEGLGVVIGHYEDARGVAPLPSAAEEGDALTAAYNARAVNATDRALDQILRGHLEDDGPFDFEAIHFAGHGESDPEKNAAYVMLSNGTRLSDFVFRAPSIAEEKKAFLFLNACQVGTAYGMLGEYAGVAGRAMRAGFRGFVAPLWSVADDVAKEISLGFYEAACNGQTVAEYLRSARRNFRETESEDAHTTWLAYLYYGHPMVTLAGPKRREEPE